MLDLHVHLLPGLDDGPRNREEALALARALVADGVDHVVATPHIYPGVFNNQSAGIAKAFDAFQGDLAAAGVPLTLSWAAEVRLCAEMIDWLKAGELPLLNGGRTPDRAVLVELPDGQIPLGAEQLMARLLEWGVTPLIAHPERNRAVMESPDRLLPLVKLGCRLQLTAASLVGEFGSKAKAASLALLSQGYVDVVASDSHNRRTRAPRLNEAREWLVKHHGDELAERLTETNPARYAGQSELVVKGAGMAIRELPPRMRAGGSSATQAFEAQSCDLRDLYFGPEGSSAPPDLQAAGTAPSSARTSLGVDLTLPAEWFKSVGQGSAGSGQSAADDKVAS